MTEGPQLDGRRASEIRREIRELAPYYAPSWDPDEGGVGAGLADVFAELATEVTERLDAVPAKHRGAFFDALGFGARPPQAARVPVQYTVTPEAPRNVAVRAGTEAIAETSEEVSFRVSGADAFEATSARLTDAIGVVPADDAVFDHGTAIDGEDTVTLFSGDDEQTHEWYVGDADLLSAGVDDTVVLDLETDADPAVLRDVVEWHYYGEGDTESGEDWQAFDAVRPVEEPQGDVAFALSPAGDFVECEVAGVESKWLRCRLPDDRSPEDELQFDVQATGIATSASGEQLADRLLANDVPQPTDPGEDESIMPFGDRPRPGDTFYVAAATALSKSGADVTLRFTPTGGESGDARTDGGAVRSGGVTASASGNQRSSSGGGAVLAEPDNQGVVDAIAEGQLETEFELSEEARRRLAEQLAGFGDGDAPIVSWEYWDGSGWSRIPDLEDGTEGFTVCEDSQSEVTFPVPEDLEPTAVAGHEEHWIRVRLVGGTYGNVIHVPTDEAETRWVRQETGSPPEFDALTVSYRAETTAAPDQVRTHNALATTDVAADEPFVPFEPLPEDEQALYFGFDAPLSGGPLQLFWAIDEHPYPAAFEPRLRWEYWAGSEARWTRLQVTDDTADLTEQGILGFALAEETKSSARYGRERHWIRARVTGDDFDVAESEESDSTAGGGSMAQRLQFQQRRAAVASQQQLDQLVGEIRITDGGSEDCGCGDGTQVALPACGATVETEPPGGEQSEKPADVTGLYANTGWARNVQTVEDEVLGGSDGERSQTFAVANPPAIDPAVWVDELAGLSEPQREDLVADRPDAVDVERSTDGELRAFWVRWTVVPDLLDSGSEDRHVVADATAGEIRFGDGTHGRIPPRGADNVRVSYETGGGVGGNVPAGAVGDLSSGLPFVEDVSNPVAGAGGADRETTSEVIERAPQELKDRGRAVAPEDYERLAADASRRIARTRAIPAMDNAGEYAPGHVTVLVVPRASSETPVPSVGLLDRVEDALGAVAPASVVERDRLVVRRPSYVSVGVDADVVAGDVGSIGDLETRLLETLGSFFHPLSGRDGESWDFGDLPTRSDVFALLEGVEGVDHVGSLLLSFSGTSSVTVGEGEPQPTVAPDVLIEDGAHDLTVTLGGGS